MRYINSRFTLLYFTLLMGCAGGNVVRYFPALCVSYTMLLVTVVSHDLLTCWRWSLMSFFLLIMILVRIWTLTNHQVLFETIHYRKKNFRSSIATTAYWKLYCLVFRFLIRSCRPNCFSLFFKCETVVLLEAVASRPLGQVRPWPDLWIW